jgi:hypothetical protein
VPAVVKVKVKFAPGLRVPESNDAGPDVDVAVCAVESLFVHVTESPVLMVSEAGVNAKF